MSLVALKGQTPIPDITSYNFGGATDALDATGERLGSVRQIWKAGNISKVHFRLGTVTKEDTIKVSIQGVANGAWPNGVIAKSGTTTFLDTNDHTWQSVTFSTALAVTVGQFIAVVIEYDSLTPDGNITLYRAVANHTLYNNCGVTDIAAPLTSGALVVGSSYFIRTYVSDDDFTNVGAASNAAGVMFVATGTTPTHWEHSSNLGVWARPSNPGTIFALEYDDGSFDSTIIPSTYHASSQNVSTSTNPDEVGNYISFPYPCRATGLYVFGDIDYDVTLSLLSGADDTLLGNCTVDSDMRNAAAVGLIAVPFDGDPATTVTIAKDTWYRVIVTPSSTSNDSIYFQEVPSAAAMDALPLGQNCHWTQRTDSGAWAETTTKRAIAGVVIDQLDNGVSSGGGAINLDKMGAL